MLAGVQSQNITAFILVLVALQVSHAPADRDGSSWAALLPPSPCLSHRFCLGARLAGLVAEGRSMQPGPSRPFLVSHLPTLHWPSPASAGGT